MNSKTPLSLIEMIILLVVFSFVSAVCMHVFVKSDDISNRSEARDYAVTITQSAAEIIRHSGGDFESAATKLGGQVSDNDTLRIDYDGEWRSSDAEAGQYVLIAQRTAPKMGAIGGAHLKMNDINGGELFSLDVMWQEEE